MLGLKNIELFYIKAYDMFNLFGINLSARDEDVSTKKSGEYKTTNTIRASESRKTNCKFELQGKYSKVLDRWTLRVKCDQHNHEPAQHMEGHPFVRRLSVDENRLVANLTRKHVAPRHILSTLKEQNENNVSVIKTIYNAQQKIRMHEKAGKTPMQVLMSILHNNNYIYELTTGASNELENLFFVHPTSWKIWRAFPHANYTWVLNCLSSTLENCMLPRVIITDRELALINACETVFPDAARLLCRWHIKQNILKHCNKIIKLKNDQEPFRIQWMLLVTSINESFENNRCYRYNHHNLKCFRLLRGFVSNEALDIILGEFQRLNDLNSDSSNCGCKLRNSCGLPCACILSGYSNSGSYVQLPHVKLDISDIKLDISDTTPVVDDNFLCDDIVAKIKESFKKQSKAGKQAYMRKLQEIYDPQKTDIGFNEA
uniref:MULE transposase domain-containing protein n=1 Tax=Lactuca sativa TaxID=4236 RepID=A0A9R1V0N7_LACSA|nr:hypothetical protein LSAT_V11C700344410 [Lactuca sativa]